MKHSILILSGLFFCSLGLAQEKEKSESDTTKIKLGTTTLMLINNSDEQDHDFDFGECDSTSNDDDEEGAAFLDLGIGGYFAPNNQLSMPAGQELLELDYARTRSIAFHAMANEISTANQRLYFAYGFGGSWSSLGFSNNLAIRPGADSTVFSLDTMITSDKYRLRSTYLEVPVLVGTRIGKMKNPLSVQVGALVGYKIGSRVKHKYQVDDVDYKLRVKDDFNLNPIKVDAIARVAIGEVGVFAKYSLLGMFKAGDGPELYPFAVGITFGDFKRE